MLLETPVRMHSSSIPFFAAGSSEAKHPLGRGIGGNVTRLGFLKELIQATPPSLVRWLLLCWVITKIICYPLWLGDRNFPLVPVHEALLELPHYFHNMLCWASFAMMIFAILRPGKGLALAIILLEIFSCLLDQNRWQPWEYQFIFMLTAFVAFEQERYTKACWQIILIGVYFFSGLSKWQPAFIHDIWSNLLLRNWLGIDTNSQWIFRFGYALPLVEIGAAAMLCFPAFKKAGVLLLIGMHLGILLCFGPLGLSRSNVIWPWNILMPFLLWQLFVRSAHGWDPRFFRKPFGWLVLLCFAILPWLHLVGRWDQLLSFTLYSGGVPQLYICSNDAALLQTMVPDQHRRNGLIPCSNYVSAYDWGMQAMRMTPYPEERVFRSIARQFARRDPQARFYIYRSGFTPTLKELLLR